MRNFLALLGLMLFAPVLRTQEHAPTVDVCRADRAAWHNIDEETDYFQQETKRIDGGPRNRNPISKLSFKEINLRIMEMATCQSVDEPNSDKYFEMHQFYSAVVYDRFRAFIVRHHLLQQFNAEDAAGAR
jgi:hypothetical protein